MALAILFALLLARVSLADTPAVPSLPLDTLPPAARARVAASYQRAAAEPASADASAAVYEDLMKEHPGLPQAHHGAGRVEAARGHPAAAVERFRRATDLFAGFGAAYYALGLAYRDLARADDARAALQLYEAHRMEAPPLDDPVLARVRRLKTGPLALLAEG